MGPIHLTDENDVSHGNMDFVSCSLCSMMSLSSCALYFHLAVVAFIVFPFNPQSFVLYINDVFKDQFSDYKATETVFQKPNEFSLHFLQRLGIFFDRIEADNSKTKSGNETTFEQKNLKRSIFKISVSPHRKPWVDPGK